MWLACKIHPCRFSSLLLLFWPNERRIRQFHLTTAAAGAKIPIKYHLNHRMNPLLLLQKNFSYYDPTTCEGEEAVKKRRRRAN